MNLRSASIADVVRLLCVFLLSAGLFLMIGCGGSSSGSGGGGTTVTVSVSPATVNVALGAQTQFTATVTGTSNTAVTWEVNGVTGGSSTTGTISTSGAYTAPATVPSSSVTISAVSQANTAVSGTATVSFPVNNMQALQVNLGPGNNYGPNGLFTDVTICVPGTSSCQDIQNVLVDTGSYGLRLLSSEVTLTLPETTDSTGDVLQECVAFADGSYTWGPVATADIQMAGEEASAVPIQVISAAPAFPAPSSCTSGTTLNSNTVQALGANGIIGLGFFQQDCGAACASSSPPAQYYLCPNSVCSPATVALTSQLQNPVWLFTQDNNGVLISLPAVPAGGAVSVSGSLIFGIGTQSDNALGSAQIYTADACGQISTTFNGTTYSDTSSSCAGGTYFDTGSEGLYILDAAALGVLACSDAAPFYCPTSTVSFTATNTGVNGTAAAVSFSVANADTLFSSNNAVFNNLAGENVGNTGSFDWGLPFFLGRNVFVGIENQNSPTGVPGPYWAF